MNEFLSSLRSPFVMHTHSRRNPTRRVFLNTGLTATLGAFTVWSRATNRPDAAALIRMPRRPGWELPSDRQDSAVRQG